MRRWKRERRRQLRLSRSSPRRCRRCLVAHHRVPDWATRAFAKEQAARPAVAKESAGDRSRHQHRRSAARRLRGRTTGCAGYGWLSARSLGPAPPPRVAASSECSASLGSAASRWAWHARAEGYGGARTESRPRRVAIGGRCSARRAYHSSGHLLTSARPTKTSSEQQQQRRRRRRRRRCYAKDVGGRGDKIGLRAAGGYGNDNN